MTAAFSFATIATVVAEILLVQLPDQLQLIPGEVGKQTIY
jgi:hypothetical protein